MLIRLTGTANKLTFYIDHDCIKVIDHAKDNPLQTVLLVKIADAQNGVYFYNVRESPDEVAEKICEALGVKPPSVLAH